MNAQRRCGEVVVPEWMYDLDGGSLSIEEIVIASVIFRSSMDGMGVFNGSSESLAEWIIPHDADAAQAILKNLVEKGIILRQAVNNDGIITNEYSFNYKIL